MSLRKPSRNRIVELRKAIVGQYSPYEPPKIYLPSQRRSKFGFATEEHERVHAILTTSTTYGDLHQILVWLYHHSADSNFKDVTLELLDALLESSFNTHEGCATICEFYSVKQRRPEEIGAWLDTLDNDYEYAYSLFKDILRHFGFEGYYSPRFLSLWIASFCLSPPLFGPFLKANSYFSPDSAKLCAEDLYSPDIRLEAILERLQGSKRNELVSPITSLVREQTERNFDSIEGFDSSDDTRKALFARDCELEVERVLGTCFPNLYYDFWSEADKWPGKLESLKLDFKGKGRPYLDGLDLWNRSDLVHTLSPAITIDRKDQAGAIAVESLDKIPFEKGYHHYCVLWFGDYREPFVICEDPYRCLRQGQIYMRIRPFHTKEQAIGVTDYYWFIHCEEQALEFIFERYRKFLSVFVLSSYGSFESQVKRLEMLLRYGLRNFYVLIPEFSVEMIKQMQSKAPAGVYDYATLRHTRYPNHFLFLKHRKKAFTFYSPISEFLLRVLPTFFEGKLEVGKIKEPSWSDQVAFRHLCNFGW